MDDALPRPPENGRLREPARRRDGAAAELAEYLRRLGERVRAHRARRGMTRKILARDSGVSERYLAQLEAGHGNISIALLRQVAEAMSVPLAELVRDDAERPIEYAMLLQRLDRLDAGQLAAAALLINAHFGPDLRAQRHRRVALVGLRGAGKTTLGRRLAEALDCPFLEMAQEIERMAGMTIDQIFDLSGQAGYRRYEKRALERIVERHGAFVLAAGGSLVSEPATYDLLLEACFTVWIKASPEEHMARVIAQGDTRPMADNAEAMDDLRRILAERDALYAKADAAVDTSGKSPDAALAELQAIVIKTKNDATKNSAK